jgi:2,4-dienoyl-CoA reductase-like NADH-dependent reductase (Old Yellow Enzyme family)
VNLFSPVALGDLQLANRVAMAPLTRMRAAADGVPGDLIAEHYAQRASTGVIVTEGTFLNAESRAYAGQPGIATDEQQAGWARVAEAVHARGGRLVMQLMHGGRVSHTAITGTDRVVAPSALAIAGQVYLPDGTKTDFPVPHALTTDEAAGVVDTFVAAARRAVDAGLDGVEVHGANGYLLHEFLSPASNVRDDQYGGSPENRARLVIDVVRAVAAEVGAGRVGLRLSPMHNIQDASETDLADVEATYGALVDAIRPLGLAYLSVLHADPAGELVQGLRARFGGPLMANSGFAVPTTRDEATALVADGHAEVVAVGRAVLANPDLVERWSAGTVENEPNPATFYADGATGYTDYPFLAEPVDAARA